MRHFLPTQLPKFNQASVLIVGDIMLDRYWFGDTARISPEAPVPVVNVRSTNHRPGGAANVALNVAALSAQTTLLGIVGQDEAAEILCSQLTTANVVHDLCRLEKIATTIKLRVISKHQQLLRIDFEEKAIEAPHDLLIARYKKYLKTSNLVILSDYNKGTLTQIGTLIQLAHEANVRVLVDPKSTDYSIYEHADIITPNFKEFEAVVGKCANETDVREKGFALLAKHNIGALLITRGEEGMTLIENGQVSHFPAYAREVFDVTGAGDTVIGVLGTAHAAGSNLKEASALANLAASIVVGKFGAATVSPMELDVVMSGKTETNQGIVNEEQLLCAVNEARSQGKKIVFTNGCFDVIHAGHVSALRLAKEFGDYLIVAVNTDESIRRLKGEHRPVNPLAHRLTVLSGLNAVDWVVPFADDTPIRLLNLIKPDILTKGSDYTIDQVVGADIVRAYGGEVRLLKQEFVTSSTSILERMKAGESHNG